MASKDNKKSVGKKDTIAKPRKKVENQEVISDANILSEMPEQLLQQLPPEIKEILEKSDIPEDAKKRLVGVSIERQQMIIHGRTLSMLPIEDIEKLNKLYSDSTEKLVDDYIAGNGHGRKNERLGLHYSFADRNPDLIIILVFMVLLTIILLFRKDIDITLQFVMNIGFLGGVLLLLARAKSIYHSLFKKTKDKE
ncbi:MAG: hypothetical protein K0U39_03760 [Alphaproteobacteria bacterium]|nr:hypothetical protein [Alphaproteobacteria bacterium]